MSYETALQRVGELRTLVGELPLGASADSAAVAPHAAFDAQLAQQRALLALGAGSTATGDPAMASTSPMSQFGLPVLTVADQYRMYGLPVPTGIQGMSGMSGSGAGERMVALAQQEIGVRESPSGSNESPRIREYRAATAGAENTPGPWCAYFVSWLAQQSGAPIGANGNGTGYVPTLEAWGRQEGRYFDAGSQPPQPGDIVIFDWNAAGVADHTGIVERVDPDGTIHTIEGNSSDQVARRDYKADTNDVRGFVRAG